MKLEIRITGSYLDQRYNKNLLRDTEDVFNGLTFDAPRCPEKGDGITLAKDGLLICGKVTDITMRYFAPDCGVWDNVPHGEVYYSVELDELEPIDWVIDKWDDKVTVK